MKKISVITVCYNASLVIEQTIISVLSQTYENIEYLIIDGQSTDTTMEIIGKYKAKIDLVLSEPDKGIYDAMNKALNLATGDMILYMNAGDTFVDEHVVKNAIEKMDDSADVIYGDNIMDYGDKKIYHKARFFSAKDINLPFNHQSSLVKLSIARQNPFNLRYKIAGDYNFFYRLYKKGLKFQSIDIPIANYVMDGFSQKHVVETYREVKEIQDSNKGFNYHSGLAFLRLKLFVARIVPKSMVEFYRSYKN